MLDFYKYPIEIIKKEYIQKIKINKKRVIMKGIRIIKKL